LLKSSRDFLVLPKLTPEKLGDDFGCEIITGRSKPAGADHNIGERLRLAKRPQDLIFIVSDLQNRGYLNSYGVKTLRDSCRISVDDSSGGEFVAGTQDDDLLNHISARPLDLDLIAAQ
jgi:hypothetical protein